MLHVIRHGRTEANAAGLLLGHLDPELDDVGKRQALAVARAVGPVDRVVSRPLLRTRRTAEAFTVRDGSPVEVDERWIEMDYGEFDGRSLAEVSRETWEACVPIWTGHLRVGSRTGPLACVYGPPSTTCSRNRARVSSWWLHTYHPSRRRWPGP